MNRNLVVHLPCSSFNGGLRYVKTSGTEAESGGEVYHVATLTKIKQCENARRWNELLRNLGPMPACYVPWDSEYQNLQRLHAGQGGMCP